MTGYPFVNGYQSELIVVECYVNGLEFRFAIDTAASDTILDKTALLLANGHIDAMLPTITLEAASGQVNAQGAILESFEALGIRKEEHLIYVYDFISNSLITEIDGLLGLDFFTGKKLCIDFIKSEISLS